MAGRIVLSDTSADHFELLSKLTLRLAGRNEIAAESYPRLYVGALPDEFPVDLSLPPHIRIIGTIIHSPETAQVYAEISEGLERVVQLFDEIMLAKGWTRMIERYHPGGFQAGPAENIEFVQYCMTDSGPALHLTVTASTEGISEITAGFQKETYGSCNPDSQRRMRDMHGLGSMVPPLPAPRGTWKSGGGASGGPDNWNTSALLDTDMTLADVMDHFAAKLAASGWHRRGTIEGENTLLTDWDLVDSEQRHYIGIMDVKKLRTHPRLTYLHLMLSKTH